MLIGGQLFRKAGDELDDPDDQAATQPRRVIMVEAAYHTTRRTHELIGPHAGVNKTWSEVQRRHYGINKVEVQWMIRACEVCQANTLSNIRPSIQTIRSSNVNKCWCLDLINMCSRPHGDFYWLCHCKVCQILLSSPSLEYNL